MTRRPPPDADTVLYGITVATSVQTLLRDQLAWFSARGWKVHLACSPSPALDEAAVREGFVPHPIPMTRTINPLGDLPALLAWFRLVRETRPGVTNVSTPKAGFLGAIASWALRVPRRVYLVRGLRLEGATGPQWWLLWLVERLTIALSTDVVVVSPSLGTALRRHRLLGRRNALLIGSGSSNGVNAREIATRIGAIDRSALRAGLGIPEDRVVIGYVGRLIADKGIPTLLQAASMAASRPSLLLIGSVDEPELADAIASADFPVVHVEWTRDAWSYYAAMDVLCLPTRREGFPNVVLESSAAGLPSITTDATGAVDSVIDQVTGLIVPVDDAPALAAAIDTLATDPQARARMGAAARERVQRDFRREDIWSGMAAVMRGAPDGRTAEV